MNALPIKIKITILSFFIVMVSLLIGGVVIIGNVENGTEEELRKRMMITARTVAQVPEVEQMITEEEGWTKINQIVEKIRIINNADYITVLNMDRVRYSHPIQSKLGTTSTGEDEGPAFAEHTYTSLAEGEVGVAVRAFVPILNANHEQIGVVIAASIMPSFMEMLATVRQEMIIIAVLTLLFGALGSSLLATHIKEQMYNLEPYEIVRILKERTATFHAMHEGIIAIDQHERITVFNQKAKEMLGVQGDVIGEAIRGVIPDTRLPEILYQDAPVYNQEIRVRGTNIMSTRIPIKSNSEKAGAVAIFQDRTEVKHLAEELTGVKAFVEALRVQNHEHMNKLHTIAGLIQLDQKDQALSYVFQVTEEHEELTQFLRSRFHDDSLIGLLLSKVSRGKELGVQVVISQDSRLKQFPDQLDHHDLVLIVGNLVENAFAALERSDHESKRIWISIEQTDETCTIIVEDNGEGIQADNKWDIFKDTYTTKGERGHGMGLHLIQSLVEKAEGEIEVDSWPGEGTSFILTVPMQAAQLKKGGGKNGESTTGTAP
ncbi:sensor histidine kinase [Pontibacillus sp. ALD_SL1]|uniref:ATP-binding protein n=1 Tax=Pontibacillus sp. ALD_SL1 TaxID=2777185 RepID=UPI001A977CEF|nr:sensor histidine kinase [Pontibacillus sp. ALD_SL1]QST01835.1 sensor histidine kinase [Pontibacillus sp. ALD_SL1]